MLRPARNFAHESHESHEWGRGKKFVRFVRFVGGHFKRRRAIPCLMPIALVFKRLGISGFPTASRLGEAGEFR